MLEPAPDDLSYGTPMFADVRHENGVTFVVVTGEVDSSSAPQLEAALRSALSAGPVLISVDMERVTFLDSSGLSALIAGYKRAGGRLEIRSPSRPVTRVLKLTGQYDRFVLEDRESE